MSELKYVICQMRGGASNELWCEMRGGSHNLINTAYSFDKHGRATQQKMILDKEIEILEKNIARDNAELEEKKTKLVEITQILETPKMESSDPDIEIESETLGSNESTFISGPDYDRRPGHMRILTFVIKVSELTYTLHCLIFSDLSKSDEDDKSLVYYVFINHKKKDESVDTENYAKIKEYLKNLGYFVHKDSKDIAEEKITQITSNIIGKQFYYIQRTFLRSEFIIDLIWKLSQYIARQKK